MNVTLETGQPPCERVLLVNDNPDILDSMRDVLELDGARVETAITPHEADEVLERGFDPSVIVVDMRLGGGERGDAYARRLRASGRYAAIPIVIMSGDVRELQRVEAGGDADATLLKPFDVERLYETLSEMCKEHGRKVAALETP